MSLLSISADAKTIKGENLGFLTGIQYFAPINLSGFQVCPMAAIAKCDKACLYSAGRGAFNSVQNARINKTKRFFSNKTAYMLELTKSIIALEKKAKKLGLLPLVRLNGTSDIRWENIVFEYKGKTANIFDHFAHVQFYDYTKIANRKNIPENYDLTFSYSGVAEFLPFVLQARQNGMRIATVFRTIDDIPERFLGLTVVGGDNSDIRHLDPKNSIVALYAKGKAKKDNTGFVVDRVLPIALVA
jgi:hypothetical protein